MKAGGLKLHDLWSLRRVGLKADQPDRIFFLQLKVVGSTMVTRAELDALLTLLDSTGLRPGSIERYRCVAPVNPSEQWPSASSSARPS